jgi:2-keto-4-pentenoate hydratase/2-oxohepta-3-ene-1,7-dioic acid hydratase in catechol pathway
MRLYCFDDWRLGVGVGDDHLVDVTSLVPDACATERMRVLIDRWRRLREAVQEAAATQARTRVEAVRIRAPLPAARNVLAAPVNYRRHREEMGGEGGVYTGAQIASIETYAGFIKASSSVIGPDEAIRLPFDDRRFDHEAEVGIVIGLAGRRVAREQALAHVFGYVPLLDITMRGPEDRSYRKSFDTFTPIGPAIVTADEVSDPGTISFTLSVSGQVRQRASTRDLIYDVPRLVELYSSAISLEPGDLIATGTPEGVGPIQPGDEIVLCVEGIGRLAMRVEADW